MPEKKRKKFPQFTYETNEVLEKAYYSAMNVGTANEWRTGETLIRDIKNAEKSFVDLVAYVKDKAKNGKRL